ncbi:chlorophyll synthesis pathway protein BchC [Niveispirillum cyanobacteriorum]|uniref:Chlorophyll synthesis pathway protein BchC n=1 Tax=Niveispirillum cyanobacteriorum TaxID=1612173 RepID=A0A2K9NGX6_9PROT|nr:chlorophyll synthesis pathway protein BchC [Niveispirillum cyanobacteriorum]AUN32312.1 chlorophyll synthesis pathway protein BchC [Niveispirillum cyanobacteriorum]GGE76247.1 chlorophyll synthesis pathway protein BchC [Niveispirillum cyanobacteriorum]
MYASAIVFEKPGEVAVRRLALHVPGPADVVVETVASGVSTGTEKMLFQGTMPRFPGMAYPLVPGYETVGRVVQAGPLSGHQVGEIVFVPGASCYADAAGLFGANASQLIVPGARVFTIGPDLEENGVLLALAATAHHAVMRARGPVDLVIGHGVLGRLIARIVMALGFAAPVVWEKASVRRPGATGYTVTDPGDDGDVRYGTAVDASGDAAAIDGIITRLRKPAELVLAGFYGERVGYAFAPAFMRELTLSIAAEFRPDDVSAVIALVETGRLSLDGLLTHQAAPAQASSAYSTAFNDLGCLKMVIDWRKAA